MLTSKDCIISLNFWHSHVARVSNSRVSRPGCSTGLQQSCFLAGVYHQVRPAVFSGRGITPGQTSCVFWPGYNTRSDRLGFLVGVYRPVRPAVFPGRGVTPGQTG